MARRRGFRGGRGTRRRRKLVWTSIGGTEIMAVGGSLAVNMIPPRHRPGGTEPWYEATLMRVRATIGHQFASWTVGDLEGSTPKSFNWVMRHGLFGRPRTGMNLAGAAHNLDDEGMLWNDMVGGTLITQRFSTGGTQTVGVRDWETFALPVQVLHVDVKAKRRYQSFAEAPSSPRDFDLAWVLEYDALGSVTSGAIDHSQAIRVFAQWRFLWAI